MPIRRRHTDGNAFDRARDEARREETINADDIESIEEEPVSYLGLQIFMAIFVAVVAIIPAALGKMHAPKHIPLRNYEDEELLRAVATRGKNDPLLLVVVGEVYDVQSGRKLYVAEGGKDGDSYDGFVNGTDASRAFLSADFTADATDDLSDLTPGQCLGIEGWRLFYRNHATYKRVGWKRGRFYDQQGNPTEALNKLRGCIQVGNAAHEAARAAVIAAPRCAEDVPYELPMYEVGVWRRYTCKPPLVPRRAMILPPVEEGQPAATEEVAMCACLAIDAAVDGGYDAKALGMEEDPALPQVYSGNCAVSDISCAVRTA